MTPRRILGIGLVVCAAFAFGVMPSFARFAYQGGIDVLTLATLRCMFPAAILLVALRAAGRPTRPAPGTLRLTVVLGITMVVASYGYLGAVRYIPVGLAVLILYTFPLMVGLISRFTEGERLTRVRLAALAVAFLGLTLAVGASFDGLDPRGVGLAMVAAVGVAVQVTVGARVVRRSTPVLVTLHMTLLAAVMLGIALGLTGGPTLPGTAAGWLATGAVALAILIAMLCLFGGLAIIGPVPAALMLNMEPLIAFGAAFVLLGEILGPWQLLGAAMVLSAVVAGQIPTRPAGAPIGGDGGDR